MKQQQLLELYDTYSNNVFRLAMSFLGNTADSEDIVQNVYTKLIEKSPHISKGKEKSYLLTMTANMCRNHLKSAANRLSSSYEELSSDSIVSGFNIEEQSMYEALGKLPDSYRTVLYLHYYEGYTFGEIAKILSPVTICSFNESIPRTKRIKRNIEGGITYDKQRQDQRY